MGVRVRFSVSQWDSKHWYIVILLPVRPDAPIPTEDVSLVRSYQVLEKANGRSKGGVALLFTSWCFPTL